MSDRALLKVGSSVLTKKGLLDRVDATIQNLYKTGNMDEIAASLTITDDLVKVSGLAKAKLLHGWSQWWNATGQSAQRNDEFVDCVESETGTTPTTTRRYVAVWQAIEDDLLPKAIQDRPMDDLIKIVTTMDGYDISEEQWKSLEHATNSAEVREILRDIKGKPPRKSGKQVVLKRDGSLYIYDKDGEHYVGLLMVDSEDKAIQNFITSMETSLGVQRK